MCAIISAYAPACRSLAPRVPAKPAEVCYAFFRRESCGHCEGHFSVTRSCGFGSSRFTMGNMRLGMLFAGLALMGAGAGSALSPAGPQTIRLETQRSSPQDLEITGDVPGVPAGQSRFLRYSELAALKQVAVTVKDDANFDQPVALAGVPLDELMQALGFSGTTRQLIAAVCTDGYEGHYTAEYRAAHHPFLVLTINSKPSGQWPRASSGEIYGPYIVSHPFFKSTFKILGQPEEPQIPFAVNQLRFYDEAAILSSLKPASSAGPVAIEGYRIVLQNCLRCHRAADIGGSKSPFQWPQLAMIANGNASAFGKYMVQPNRVNPEATMPPNPAFDAATVAAVTAYFQSQGPKP